jgi:hypothetical protein
LSAAALGSEQRNDIREKAAATELGEHALFGLPPISDRIVDIWIGSFVLDSDTGISKIAEKENAARRRLSILFC